MFCKQCGKEVKDGVKFCTNCGCKIEYVHVDIKNNTIDEFELEKQILAQEELEKKVKEEKAKKEELLKEKIRQQKELTSKFVKKIITSAIFVCIITSFAFSFYSLYFYFSNNGIVKDGEDIMFKIDGLYQKNVRIKYNGKTYYLGNDGRPQLYKLSTIGDKIKAQDQSGNYIKNQMIKIDGDYYHFNENGEALKNELYDDYYFGSDGIMIINSWNDDYYFGEDGKMQKSKWIDNYYVGTDGKYLKSTWTPDGFYVNDNGEKVINNKVNHNGKLYFVGEDGKKVINSWCSLGTDKYHTDNSGVLYVRAKFRDNGKIYYFKNDGTMLKGAIADGHYADLSGILVTNKAIGRNYFDSDGDIVVDKWIGDIYYDKYGIQVLTGWAQDYYLMNGIKQVNKWVDNDYYYVGADGKYLKNTYVNGCQLGSDGKWTGVVDYGIEISYGNSRNYNYTGNSYSNRRYFFNDDDDDIEQDVNVIRVTSITSSNGALDSNQLNNMRIAINSCLDSIFENYKSEIRMNPSVILIECNGIVVSSQQYNKIRFYCNTRKELFTGTTVDASFYITYNISSNLATKG